MAENPSDITIHHAIGYAIEQWGGVEDAMCHTFSLCVGGTDPRNFGPAAAAFWATHSFRNKLEVTNAAMKQAAARPCLIKTWDTLHQRLKKRNKNRNQLAHFAIMFHYSPDGSHQQKLQPYHSQTKQLSELSGITEQMKLQKLTTPHRIPQLSKGYEIQDILQRAKSFNKTNAQIRNYNRALKAEINYFLSQS